MEATLVYRGSIGIMEKKMETTLVYSDSGAHRPVEGHCSCSRPFTRSTV